MIPVAVTGLGVVSALGIGVDAFWLGLLAGRSGLLEVPEYAALQAPRVGCVQGLSVRAFAELGMSRRIDRTSLLALAACRLAIADAGGVPADVPPSERAMVLGSALGNLGETRVFLDRLHEKGTGNPLLFPNLVMNAALSYASIELAFTGPTALVTEQDVTGEAAIQWGVEAVATGRAGWCIAGAADEIDLVIVEVLRDAGALARGSVVPFGHPPRGIAPGEGAAVVVLEPLDAARARGARVYAAIEPHLGFSTPAPVFGWVSDTGALGRRVGAGWGGVGCVVAGAEGSARDASEAAVLSAAFENRLPPVTAPRAACGTFGSAGALCVAAAVLAVHHGRIPPTAAVGAPSGIPLVGDAAVATELRSAAVLGLGRGGVCRPVRVDRAPA